MRTRTFWKRGVLPLTCLALLTVWVQVGHPQPQPVPGQVPPPPQVDLPSVSPATTPVPTPVPGDAVPLPLPTRPAPVLSPAAPTAPTVEDLIRQLEQLRKQKADLEQQEKAVAAKLQERLKAQSDRLNKLGILLPAQPVVEHKQAVEDITLPDRR